MKRRNTNPQKSTAPFSPYERRLVGGLGVLALLVTAGGATAYAEDYSQSTVANTFVPLASPTVIVGSGTDDGAATVVPPFPIRFYENTFTDMTVGFNGAILFPGGLFVSLSNAWPGSASSPNNWIAPFWDDLRIYAASGFIGHQTEGIAPNRTFTIEYHDISRFGASGALFSMQVRFFEYANRIEVDYGPITGAASFSSTMGMEDSTGGLPHLFSPSGCTTNCNITNYQAMANQRVVLEYRCGNGILNVEEECDNGVSNSWVSDATCRPDCTAQRCGDGITDPVAGESCDDGAQNGTDGMCTPTCDGVQVCGDGVVQGSEVCEDGNFIGGDGCSADCLSDETCGNGYLDSVVGETCDDGNTVDGDGCQADCILPQCGDGIADPGETCDDGNSVSGDGCESTCQLVCGTGSGALRAVISPSDGGCLLLFDTPVDTPTAEASCMALGGHLATVADASEDASILLLRGAVTTNTLIGYTDELLEGSFGWFSGSTSTYSNWAAGEPNNGAGNEDCTHVRDDGTWNDVSCSAVYPFLCESPYVCGNGVADPGEVCDDGNTVSDDGCNASCTSDESCGNGIVDTSEVCDDGNLTDGDGCAASCLSDESCGNGVVDSPVGETCDDGNNVDGDGCQANCALPACGDAILDAGEVCDDGNTADGDGCAADCVSDETCGNGVVDSDVGEACDDGNNIDGDGCQANCALASCGDGILDPTEACDDGNNANGDGCNETCTSDETCGNGVIDGGEVCDDDNTTDGDGCAADCASDETCGNGVIDGGEVCDDGNNANDDGCNETCISDETCGNGVVDDGEFCDDGSNVNGDGCSADCLSDETCGNGSLDLGETCDNGTANSDTDSDACRSDCVPATCGDGVTDTGEACDNGVDNDDDLAGECSTMCTVNPTSSDSAGCGCQTTSPKDAGFAFGLMLLGLMALRRRRCRGQRNGRR